MAGVGATSHWSTAPVRRGTGQVSDEKKLENKRNVSQAQSAHKADPATTASLHSQQSQILEPTHQFNTQTTVKYQLKAPSSKLAKFTPARNPMRLSAFFRKGVTKNATMAVKLGTTSSTRFKEKFGKKLTLITNLRSFRSCLRCLALS